ncbi:MAG: response regulator [Lachnospira sp.]|uniref:Stage 0 sporulation protein A homolog n=1 Tax=Lachnospira pectinoschiza TaxID=28052 RepID=A0A1G9WTY4_9FIRM|nr:response regulator [Lachnospira pectinoschiza]MCR5516845.1 response regulator [Lachnospira sp.]SDM87615.1 Chemotaxis phosphatase CheX [Lachnospira pectinoschiza]
MFSQLFGKYLIETDVISEEELDEIIKSLRDTRAKIGFLAVAKGMLTETEASEINRLQALEDARFGDIAVSKGFLSQQQLDELLKDQNDEYVKFIQVLSEEKNISMPEINGFVEDFKKQKGFDDKEIEALKANDVDAIVPIFAFASKAHITDLVALVLRNLTRFVSTDYYIEKIQRVKEMDYNAFTCMELKGDANIHLGFLADDDVTGLTLIANRFAGEEYPDLDEEVFDSVGEFLNCIAGLFATNASHKGVKLEILPQFTYENQTAIADAYVLPIYIEGREVFFYVTLDEEAMVGKNPMDVSGELVEGSVETADSKGRIVIVDDSGLSRNVLRKILEDNNFTVVCEASDGVEAVEAYLDYKPDIITLDITMPHLNGNEALKQIIKADPDANVIMITAAGQENKIIDALKAGAKRFITKPFSESDILKNVNEVLGL